ncbi:MAG: magnesium chelatase ATPase subunit I [Deltaproteobacteria bacterium]|nr:MAG: magnesium chelatase ATPase subunit I [Deltaproteobacteria bacterium]
MSKQPIYPFVALVRQEKMKLALILNIINPTLSGVLIRGEKGTGKSTAVRALAEILPEIEVIRDCVFQLSPLEAHEVCSDCMQVECRENIRLGQPVETFKRQVRVIELPVGATEDRVVGTLDLEQALKKGEKRMEPGLLAAAHRGILYVDEVNLLDDHVVDVLLDSAAMGINTIEREGVSFSHPARFTLVGTMNPEEGELRPQLLDRFGLCVHIESIQDPEARVTIMERRAAFDEDPEGFCQQWERESKQLGKKIETAINLYPQVTIARPLLFEIAAYCLDVGVDGHRGDIIIMKAAKSLAAYHGRTEVTREDIDLAAEIALPHRVRRQPLQDIVVDVKTVRR